MLPPTTISIHEQLKEVFGYNSFRRGQESIITSLMEGKDQLVIMPTGGGKSICYQLPASLLPNLTIVISPLIALMEDQVAALTQQGIPAASLHSNKSFEERKQTESDIDNGTLKLLYAAPETILQPSMLQYLQTKKISLIAIDEAHCVSVWGNDFRPEYVSLKKLIQLFPATPCIALTATADEATQEEIKNKLGLRQPEFFKSSFERKNITITTFPGLDRIKKIVSYVSRKNKQAGIIYCLSRKSTESISGKLQQAGIKAAYYHAGMDARSRSLIQQRFQNDEIDVVCATIAFGMGIDKSNVRYVIHYNLPKNVESYYQEIGRAGRDGLASEALLFYSWGDVIQLRRFIEDGDAAQEFRAVQSAKLDRMWELANSFSCRTNFILNYFGEYRSEKCGHCDNCLHPPQSFDGTVLAQKALSAVARTKQSANLSLIQDILKGAYKDEVKARNFDHLKTYGAGRDLTYPEWQTYLTQLVNLGYLKIDYTDRSHLKLTPLSTLVLKGEEKVDLFKFEKKKSTPAKQKKIIIVEDDLFEILREWRARQAKNQRVPAYTIMHDKTLKELSSSKPTDFEELDYIGGIGKAKKAKYGKDILKIIREYIKDE